MKLKTLTHYLVTLITLLAFTCTTQAAVTGRSEDTSLDGTEKLLSDTSGVDTYVLLSRLRAGMVLTGGLTASGSTTWDWSGSSANFKTSTGTTILGGPLTTAYGMTQTSTSATAFESGPNGGTNPVFRLVNNISSAATGLSVTGRAAAAGVDLSVISSGSNENLVVEAKGTGVILLNGTASGAVNVGSNTTPSFSVVHTTEGTGVLVTSAAAGSGVSMAAISSGTDENITLDAKGAGTITLNGTGTGNIALGRSTTLAGTLVQTSAAAAGFATGPNGNTNPVFRTVNNVSTAATGLSVTGRAAAAGVDLTVLSSGTNENLVVDAKGSGVILLNGTGTGAVNVGDNTTPALSVVHTTEGTGVSITSAAAAGGVAVAAISSGTNENLTIDAKGSGTVTINGTGTGSVRVGTGLLSKDLTEVVTATNVITAAESGSVFFLNSATEFVSTLPAAAAGLHYTFIVTAAPSGASYTIVTNASANIIKGNQNSVAGDAGDFGTADDTISFVDSQSVAGDKVEVFCDGTNWFAYGISKVAAGLTFTQAN
jgi:hypothetical protein